MGRKPSVPSELKVTTFISGFRFWKISFDLVYLKVVGINGYALSEGFCLIVSFIYTVWYGIIEQYDTALFFE